MTALQTDFLHLPATRPSCSLAGVGRGEIIECGARQRELKAPLGHNSLGCSEEEGSEQCRANCVPRLPRSGRLIPHCDCTSRVAPGTSAFPSLTLLTTAPDDCVSERNETRL